MILVFVVRGDRVFIVMSELEDRLEQIPACEAKWNQFEKMYREAQGADGAHYEQEGHEAYRRCFGRAIRTLGAFASVTRRAQAIVDRLQADEASAADSR